MRHTTLLALLLAGLSSLGCGPDFDPYNRLNSLRVLAVKSEPAAPGPGETTTLSALVYTPEPAVLTYAWSWCPFAGPASDGYPCRITQQELSMLTGAMVPPLDLGTATTAELANSIDPMVVARLCAGEPGIPQLLDCEGGFPVQVKLSVRSPDDEVITVRTVRLRFDAAIPANGNPQIDGLTALVGDAEQPIGDTPTVTLPRKEKTVIKAQVPESFSETYRGKNDNGEIVDGVRERLFLSWFIESGDSDDERTGFIADQVPFERALMNKWEPADREDYPSDTARLFVIIRDSRGGVGWRSGIVRLGATP
jgi:hypothetical protein